MRASGEWSRDVPTLSLPLVLVALLSALAASYGATYVDRFALTSFTLTLIVQAAAYLVAVLWVLQRGARPRDLILILLAAFVIRGLAMTAAPNLTTDALRYVWDGRIQWEGWNPYLYVPADERLAYLRDSVIYPDINQKETAVTIYPPVAEMIFALAVKVYDGIEGIKLVMLAFEALTIWLVMRWLQHAGLPRERVIIYAWHPLPIWEFASQGHIDAAATALMMATVVAAVQRRETLAGAALAVAVACKYFPLVLVPALWRRWAWKPIAAFVVVLVLVYLPYWIGAGPRVLGFLFNWMDAEGYGSGWGFHVIWVLRDFAIADPPRWIYLSVALAVLGGLAMLSLFARRADEIVPAHLVMLGAAFVFFTSPHYPWYFGWLIPLCCRFPSPAVIGFTLLALLQNVPGDGEWLSTSNLFLTVFGGFVVLAAIEVAWRWRRRHV